MRSPINSQRRLSTKRAFKLVLACTIASSTLLGLPSVHAQDRAGAKGNNRAVPATAASNVKSAAPQPAAANPKEVAIVNGQPVLRSDLAQQCVLRYGEDVLENMVNKYLILQACLAQKIEITQKDVDDEIARTASKFNLSMPQYLKLIQDERDITPEQYSSDVIWPMLALRALAKGQVQVSPQEIDQAFQSEFGPKVQVRMIACKDKAKITQLHKDASAKPDSFKTLAKNHSEDPSSASVEGLLPPIRKFTGDDELENIAFALQPNQVSKIFSAGDMHVILQCVRHLPPTTPPAPQMQEIQNRIRMEIQDEKMRESAEGVFANIREQSTVTKILGKPELQQQYPGVVAIINRQSVTLAQLEDECIVRHGKQTLEGEINRKLIEDALARARMQVTQPEVDAEIARAADYYGFVKGDGSPDVEKWLKNVLSEDGASIELYVRDAIWPTVALKKLIADRVKVTEEDLRKGFESNYGPRAEVLAIVLSNQRTAQEVWELARNNKTEKFFGELAAQYSVEPSSRSNMGKVPPLRRFGGQPNLEKAAFDLKPGELSAIVEVGGQYVVMYSQGLTTPVVQDFAAVKDELYKDILEKKLRIEMDNQMGQLVKDAQVVNFLDPKKSHVGEAESKALLNELKNSETRR